MPSYNRAILAGNLTRDPEARTLPSGAELCEFSLAVNESYKTKAGEQRENVCFVDVVVWGNQAGPCVQYLSKGSGALVEGRLQQDTWETDDGQKRSKIRVRADRVVFLGKSERRAEDEMPDNTVGSGADLAPVPSGDDDNLPFL